MSYSWYTGSAPPPPPPSDITAGSGSTTFIPDPGGDPVPAGPIPWATENPTETTDAGGRSWLWAVGALWILKLAAGGAYLAHRASR